jgi:hypothetical protein
MGVVKGYKYPSPTPLTISRHDTTRLGAVVLGSDNDELSTRVGEPASSAHARSLCELRNVAWLWLI